MTSALVPIRHAAEVVVSNVDKKSVDGEATVRLVNYTDVYYNRTIAPELQLMGATATADQVRKFRVLPGDTLITKDSETPADIAVPAYVEAAEPDMVCGYHLALLRPKADYYPKFLYWAIASDHSRDQFSVSANGMTRYGLTYDAIQSVELSYLPLEEQRRIADFLDDQATRIDLIITARQHQIDLIEERQSAALHDVFAQRGWKVPTSLDESGGDLPDGWRVAELGHVLRQLTNGYVGPTRDILFEEGIPYIQSLHIKKGKVDFDRRPYYVAPEWHRERPRIHLREGDVLIVQTGAIGQVAVVPAGFGEASCHALQIARVERSVLSGQYLGEYLRSPFAQAHLLARATGALHPHLEAGIKSAPVVVPPPLLQHEILSEVNRIRSSVDAASRALSESILLLQAFKRSLISAAVSGEFDVSAASGRGVPA